MTITKVLAHVTVITGETPIQKFLVEDSNTKSKWFIEETHDDFNENLPAVQAYLKRRRVSKVCNLPTNKAHSASQRKAHMMRRELREHLALKAACEKLTQLQELAEYKASILRTTGELIDFTGIASNTGLGQYLHNESRETRLIAGRHVVKQKFKSVWSDNHSESGATDAFDHMTVDPTVPRM